MKRLLKDEAQKTKASREREWREFEGKLGQT
jgi:hypothetical protein